MVGPRPEPPAAVAFRATWWMEDPNGYQGPRFEGEVWQPVATPQDFQMLSGRAARMVRGVYDALEVRLENGQLVRYRQREKR